MEPNPGGTWRNWDIGAGGWTVEHFPFPFSRTTIRLIILVLENNPSFLLQFLIAECQMGEISEHDDDLVH